MTENENWLSRFETMHRSLRNPIVYWAAVPMLVTGITGLLWISPIPAEFEQISPLLNWGSAFLMVTAIYYFIISLGLAIGLLPLLLGLASIQLWLENSGYPTRAVALGFTVAGIIGLALGRGNSLRAIFQDLLLVMIAPAWLLSIVYRRFGIPV